MATIIGRNTPTADIKISAAGGGAQTSYKAQFSAFSVRSVIGQIDVSTFNDEPNSNFESTETIFVASMTGFLMTGAGAWLAFFPPPQNVDMTLYWTTTCSIGGKWNFAEVLATRPTNGVSLLSGNAQGRGTMSIAFV